MSTKRKTKTISATRNYRMFKFDRENRVLELPKHRKLKKSMQQYGFLECFPVVCKRGQNRELIVPDGQHRVAFAEELGLPVYYVVTDVDFDIAVVNCTAKVWTAIDYARKFAENGNEEYQRGLEFAERHRLPIGVTFALLSGTTTFGNIKDDFESGHFKVKDQEWADMVASTYKGMVVLSSSLRNARFLAACMALGRVKDFDPDRLLQGARRCRDKLLSYSTRDAYLDMAEEVYNFGRQSLVPIKIMALQALKDRCPVHKNGKSVNGKTH